MRAKDALGRHGEDLAATYLAGQGYAILERNWRCAEGEIDIVALDGDDLVVCEVKTRTTTRFGSPLEAITWRKARRLRALAARWLAEHDVRPRAVRIDVVGIVAADSTSHTIAHVRGAQ